MMDKQLKTIILQKAKQFEGKTISVENALDNVKFIKKSKCLARKHEWLYHCTTDIALLSIIKNREVWLSNLKIVNDKEEVKKVDVPEYINTYYVACFTYDSKIPEEHWKEYGNLEHGVLIGIKPEWIRKKATFMCGDNSKTEEEKFNIFENDEEALNYKIAQQLENRCSNPFFINSFGFYQVIYDDELVKTVEGECSMEVDGQAFYGRSFTPEIVGIVKSTKGLCRREGKKEYEKDWRSEKEVRLKIGVQQLEIFKNGHECHDGMIMGAAFPKIAVPMSEDAFNEINIGFSPKFKNQKIYLQEIEKLLPNCKINVLK